MSKRASPTVVGIFVIVAAVLAMGAIVLLGGKRAFRDTAPLVVYFDGSVGGLRLGAPVKFRGIDIGTVKDLRINITGASQDPKRVRIPVVLEIDIDRVTAKGVTSIDLRDPAQVRTLVDRGLRAELATESLVTGLRYVSLDIRPNTPASLLEDGAAPYPEIPAIRSPLEQAPEKVQAILTKLADVDVARVADSVQAAADDAHRLLGSPHLVRAVTRLDELTASLNRTVGKLETTAGSLDPVIESAHRVFAADSRLSTRLDTTLGEIAAAARSMRRLTDQVARDPGSVVRGGRP